MAEDTELEIVYPSDDDEEEQTQVQQPAPRTSSLVPANPTPPRTASEFSATEIPDPLSRESAEPIRQVFEQTRPTRLEEQARSTPLKDVPQEDLATMSGLRGPISQAVATEQLVRETPRDLTYKGVIGETGAVSSVTGEPLEPSTSHLEIQRTSIQYAKGFYTGKTEPDGTPEYVEFPSNVRTPETRYRLMELYGGTSIPAFDANGKPLVVPNENDPTTGKQFYIETIPVRRLKEELQDPTTKAGKFLDSLNAVLVGGAEPIANLQELDKRLKLTGLNDYGRLQFIQMAKSGALDTLRATQDAASIVAFALESPDYLAQGMQGLYGVGIEGYNYLMSDVPPGEEPKFEPGKYMTNFYDVPGVVEMLSKKYKLAPDVTQAILRTQGVGENLVKYGLGEAPTYGVVAFFKMGSALSKFSAIEKEAVTRFGGKNFAEAMEKAYEQGIDYATFRNDFINMQTNTYSRARLKENIDTGVAMVISDPEAAARSPVLRQQVEALGDQIDEAYSALANAKKAVRKGEGTVDSKIVKDAEKRLTNLQNQQQTLIGEKLTPSTLRNLGAEYGYTVTAMSGFTEVYRQFFGGTGEYQPLWEFGAAMAMGFESGRQGVQKTAKGSYRFLKNVLRWSASRVDNPFSLGFSDMYKEVLASEKLDIQTKNFFRELDKLGPEVQSIFMAGAEESAILRRDLIALSNMTGVKVDPDLLIETVGDVGMMGSLITLGRSVDQKLTLTDFENAGPMILQKEQNLQGRAQIVTRMADALKQLTTLTIAGNAGPESSVYQVQRRLQSFLKLQGDRLFQDQQALTTLEQTPARFLELAMKGDYHRLSGGLSDIQNIEQIYDFQTRAAGLGMSPETMAALNLTPTEAFQQTLQTLEENSTNVRRLLEEAGETITPEMASTGAASVHSAKAFAVLRKEIDTKAQVLYRAFELNNEKARSDISSVLREINNNPSAFIDFNPDEVAQGLISLEKGSLMFKDRRAFGALFDSAADRTLEYFRRELGEDFGTLMEDLKVGDDHPASQWMALDNFLKSTDASEAFGEQMVQTLQENMPLLATPQEWRILDRSMGQAIGRYEDNVYYKGLRQRWREVGDPESPLAWKTGWDTGEPQNVAPEKFNQWRTAQKFYEDNVADRIYYSPKFRQWDNTLSTKAKEAIAKGGDITAELSKVSPNLKATQWLDDGLQKGLSRLRQQGSNLPLVGDELYDEFGEIIGKLGGVKDPATGRFFIITASESADDLPFISSGKEVQRSVQLWLQGKAVNSATGGKLLGADYDPNMTLDNRSLEALITSFENIPVYRRTSNGNLEMVGPLVNGEEVRRVINPGDVNAELVYGREKLEDARDLANDFVASVKQDSATYIRNVEYENKIIEDTMARLNLGSKTTGIDNIEKTAEAVYQALTTGDFMSSEIPALRKALSSNILRTNPDLGPEESSSLVDTALRNLVMTHIEKEISKVGDFFPMKIDKTGETVYMPSIGLDHTKLYEMIGLNDPRKAEQLRSIIGGPRYEMLLTIGRTVERVAAREKTMVGVSGRVPSISLETGLSRGLQVQKQTVSTQYVAFELLLRQARSRAGSLLKAMLNDPELGKSVLRAIDTGEVPPSLAQPNAIRQLVLEGIRQEALYSNVSDVVQGEFGDIKLDIEPRPVEMTLPLKAQPFAEQVRTEAPRSLPEAAEEQAKQTRVQMGLRELGFDITPTETSQNEN